ncbi:MAG: adenylate/guanylate cyclase domain-containing protein [Polaromonas sp.]|nr:adenylate/guanylate cyclase domain-containing protein [Polaromonas sp.]
MPEVTVVFADLTGSTRVFESLGNAKATQAITRLTQWMGKVSNTHGGQVVKYLGDGVLMIFPDNQAAVDATVEMQRHHTKRIATWPDKLKMYLQIGLARGAVVTQDGDCYGDAVNVASRLSDLAGDGQIFATDVVIDQLHPHSLVRFRSLGPMDIRGRNEPCVVSRIEWQSEVMTDQFTVPAPLPAGAAKGDAPDAAIALAWLDVRLSFGVPAMPVALGRDPAAHFVVNDPRVSRLHARISWSNGTFKLEDASSYGTWVRFAGSDTVVSLRRQDCVLHGQGEIALGAGFEDFSVPTISFELASTAAK